MLIYKSYLRQSTVSGDTFPHDSDFLQCPPLSFVPGSSLVWSVFTHLRLQYHYLCKIILLLEEILGSQNVNIGGNPPVARWAVIVERNKISRCIRKRGGAKVALPLSLCLSSRVLSRFFKTNAL